MRGFPAFFRIDAKRFFRLRNVMVMILLFGLAMYFVNSGINHYKDLSKSKIEFQELERLKIELYYDWYQYSTLGFRLIFIPGPNIVFGYDTAPAPSELVARIDTTDVLTINLPFTGSDMFRMSSRYNDFSGILFLLGSFFMLYLGYDSFKSRAYLKILASTAGSTKATFFTLLSGFLLTASTVVVFIGSGMALSVIRGVIFTSADILHLAGYTLALVMMLVFFYSLGMAFGTFSHRFLGGFLCIAAWIIFVFVIPGAIDNYIKNETGRIESNYKTELQKYRQMSDFENHAKEVLAKVHQPDLKKEELIRLAESFYASEFKKIEAIEAKRINATLDIARRFHALYIFSPPTAFLATAAETSGNGWLNHIEFHKYLTRIKNKFTRLYIDKGIIEEQEIVENIVKGNEDIFEGQGRFPPNYRLGLILTLFYILVLFTVTAYNLKQDLLAKAATRKEQKKLKSLDLELGVGKKEVQITRCNAYAGILYSLLNNARRWLSGSPLRVNVRFSNRDIGKSGFPGSFLYLCPAHELPGDLKVEDFILLMAALQRIKTGIDAGIDKLVNKYMQDLDDDGSLQLMLFIAGMGTNDVIILDRLVETMTKENVEQVDSVVERITKQGTAVILFQTRFVIDAPEKADIPEEYDITDDSTWDHTVGTLIHGKKSKTTS